MTSPLRRLVGNVLLLVYLVVYCFFALAIGDVVVTTKPGWVQFVYFLVAGLAWVPLAGLLIRWMYRRAGPG